MTLDTLPEGTESAPRNPNATDPGVTSNGPTGGGKATPDDAILQGPGNQESGTLPPLTDESDAPVISAGLNTGPDDFSGVPTGGLQADGTIGGIPTGSS